MDQETVVTLEQAMEAASESVANLKRFTESLDKFLKTNSLGSAEYSEDCEDVIVDHGYNIGMFRLCDRPGDKDVLYFYIYSDGTVQGENFSISDIRRDLINHGCTYAEAAREVLKTVGAFGQSKASADKIAKAIEALEA